MKLTQTQKNILIRMDRGETIHINRHRRTWTYLSGKDAVRFDTFVKLKEAGLIDETEVGWRAGISRITDKGREAMRG